VFLKRIDTKRVSNENIEHFIKSLMIFW